MEYVSLGEMGSITRGNGLVYPQAQFGFRFLHHASLQGDHVHILG